MHSGIYAIINNNNGNTYIGQASDLSQRWRAHRHSLRIGAHHCIHLQLAWLKYGETSFSFIVLEECPKMKAFLTEAEQFWFDYSKFIGISLYNIAKVAESQLGCKRSDEFRERMRIHSTGRHHTMSPNGKQAIALASLGNTKGRANKGENHGLSKLTLEQVTFIRSNWSLWKDSGLSDRLIGEMYDVHQSTISNLISNKSWVA